jgi:transcriptional regulator with XRE-family HTH domain
MSDLEALADAVRSARKRKRWSQEDLAERAGVTLGVVSNLERMKSKPQLANRRALLKALSIDADEVPEESEDEAAEESWPRDIEVLVHVVRMTLSSLSPKVRTPVIFDMTRQAMELMTQHMGDDAEDDSGDDA